MQFRDNVGPESLFLLPADPLTVIVAIGMIIAAAALVRWIWRQ